MRIFHPRVLDLDIRSNKPEPGFPADQQVERQRGHLPVAFVGIQASLQNSRERRQKAIPESPRQSSKNDYKEHKRAMVSSDAPGCAHDIRVHIADQTLQIPW